MGDVCSILVKDNPDLKELPYSPAEREKMRQIGDRLNQIPLDELEKPIQDFLASLGKIDRYWLTELEETLLSVLEEKLKD